jgi:hypothetical protein
MQYMVKESLIGPTIQEQLLETERETLSFEKGKIYKHVEPEET